MSQDAVRAIIESRLRDWADQNDFAVAWENVGFDPSSVPTYLAFHLLPAQTRSEDLAGRHRAYTGVAQISIVMPTGNGPGDAEQWVKGLEALFPCEAPMSGAGIEVLVLTPVSAGPGIPDETHYIVPVSFQYRADVI